MANAKRGRAVYWRWPESIGAQRLARQLGELLNCEPGICTDYPLEVLDSFGWTIWHSGALLYRTPNGELSLETANGRKQRIVAERPRFWWQLPPGPASKRLRKLLGHWSFNPVAQLPLRQCEITRRHAQRKIVVRGELISTQGPGAELHYVCLRPVRGHQQEFAAAAQTLQAHGAIPCETSILRDMLEQLDLPARAVRSRRAFGLNPSMNTGTALALVLVQLTQHARQYETGIRQDTDTEFLHQYRVNLRKARSLLSLMKKAFEPDQYRLLKSALRGLAAPTGTLRDLDVFALDKAQYASLLPDSLRAGIDALGHHLAQERSSAQRNLRTWLDSADYVAAIRACLTELQRPPRSATRLSQRPIQDVVSARALARYRRIASLGRRIDQHTPDEAIHALRIECKKLRYLLECFAELYTPARIQTVIRDLKGLQDILGQFNDCAVQQEFLLNQLQAPGCTATTSAAVGGLVALLHQRQNAARTRLRGAFAAFARDDVATHFAQSFPARLDPAP